jgi:hypothetical protein
MMLTIEQIKANGWLVFETIMGSKAYGLDTERSDTDIRGVYVLPKSEYYSLEYTAQVSNQSNDIVYYELKRFIELLARNNPNILELLAVPSSCILYKHEIMSMVRQDMFLSRLCEKTFANYAYTQIKKAQGLEKKIVNPVDEVRKSVLDFCFVYAGNEAVDLDKFLSHNGFKQEDIGLAAIPHLRDCYNMYHSRENKYPGVTRKDSNDVCLSSIPKGEMPVGLLYFNKDGYSVYCRKYKEYWDWVENRNEERYRTTISHGRGYDSKNMMHVFRLLFMAKEIATEGTINVWRKDRDFLLAVKKGQFEYEELVVKAQLLKDELGDLYQASVLPEEPSMERINKLLVDMRTNYYRINES